MRNGMADALEKWQNRHANAQILAVIAGNQEWAVCGFHTGSVGGFRDALWQTDRQYFHSITQLPQRHSKPLCCPRFVVTRQS